MSRKVRILNWLFEKIFGEVDIDAEIYTTEDSILVLQLVVKTRFGNYSIPLLHKQLPQPKSGYIIDAVKADSSLDAGIIDHVGGILTGNDEDEDTRPA